MSENKSLHVLIEGRVQGVGFRYYTQSVASQLGLAGFVRNLPDGRVEACAEGDEEALRKFLARLRQGPGYSLVTDVVESWREASGKYTSFRVTY